MALEPDDLTSTTWAARIPEGTAQVGAAFGFGLGLGLGFGLGLAARVVVAGLGLGAGVVVVLDVVVVGGAVVDDDVADDDVAGERVGDTVSAPPEQPASTVTAASTTVVDHGADQRRGGRPDGISRVIGRSAGSRGGTTGRPSATPGS